MLPHDDVGAGAALVLLHAGVADRRMWSEHLQPLTDAGYRVVALDLPGFGEAPVISSPVSSIESSPALKAAADAEEAALEEGDIEAAVEAVLAAWTLPDAPVQLRERLAKMQRRAFALQADAEWGPEGADPLEHDLAALAHVEAPAVVVVGEHDMEDFHIAAEALLAALPNARKAVLPDAGHLAPLERPEAFREMLLRVLSDRG